MARQVVGWVKLAALPRFKEFAFLPWIPLGSLGFPCPWAPPGAKLPCSPSASRAAPGAPAPSVQSLDPLEPVQPPHAKAEGPRASPALNGDTLFQHLRNWELGRTGNSSYTARAGSSKWVHQRNYWPSKKKRCTKLWGILEKVSMVCLNPKSLANPPLNKRKADQLQTRGRLPTGAFGAPWPPTSQAFPVSPQWPPQPLLEVPPLHWPPRRKFGCEDR